MIRITHLVKIGKLPIRFAALFAIHKFLFIERKSIFCEKGKNVLSEQILAKKLILREIRVIKGILMN